MAKLYTFQVNVVHPQMQLEELIVNVSFHQNKGKKKRGGVVRKPNVQNLQVLVLDEKKVSIDEIK